MPSEVRLINERLGRRTEGKLECFPYYQGWIGKQKVVVAVTGVGVTNGAMVASLFIHHFQPSELVVSGTGSRFNPRIRTGDTIISRKTIPHAAGTLTAKGMIYRWDGSQWLATNPATRPPARWQTAMAYDPVNGAMLLFGGRSRLLR